jgi:hypothetical protein
VVVVNNLDSPYRISKRKTKGKSQHIYTYEKYGKPTQEPSKLVSAKLKAPKQTKNNVIFFWDHETDTFKFTQDLRKLRNETPSTKTSYLKHLQEDELIKLEFMLKKSRHYLPIQPNVKYYFYLPVIVLLLYLLGCLLWYAVLISE